MDASVTFRIVSPEDVPALVKLRLKTRIETYSGIYPSEWIDGFDFALSEERFRGIAADSDQQLYLIEIEGEPVGYLCYGRELESTLPKNSICINMLYLLRSAQRRGIGTMVFERLRAYCRQQGKDRFYNGCNMHNESALRFYRSMGGRIIAEHGGHENHALDQAIFEHLVDSDQR